MIERVSMTGKNTLTIEQVDAVTQKKWKDWKAAHKCQKLASPRFEVICSNSSGIGVAMTGMCSHCKEEIDLTEYDKW